jgi:hypothetical protein
VESLTVAQRYPADYDGIAASWLLGLDSRMLARRDPEIGHC